MIIINILILFEFDFNFISAGFYGKNNVDMSRIDCICSCFYAIMDDYLRMYQDKDGWIMVSNN